MRTQIAKTGYLPAEYISPTFSTRDTPPLFAQVHRGGCYREKFFYFFSDFRLVYPILGFQLNSFTEYLRFNLFIFARYYLDYDSWLRFWISTRFSSHQFRLVSALSILRFDSSACYKQTSMLMRVCFMLVLAILRLSDVFSFVLGVVYRLWLK